jgi:hypothetical protein
MSINYFSGIILLIALSLSQIKEEKYHIVDKGITITVSKRNTRLKFPFGINHDFFFTAKNDSTAIIQDVFGKKFGKAEEHRISQVLDSSIVTRHTYVNGKGVIRKEVSYYKKVY